MEFSSVEDLLTKLVEAESGHKVSSVSVKDSSDSRGGGSTGQLTATAILSNGESLSLFSKVNTRGGEIDKLFRILDREILMYSEFLPSLKQLQIDRSGQDSLASLFPKFYGSGSIGETVYLVFENIIEDGYSVSGYQWKKADFDLNDKIEFSLSKLGIYHALSFAWLREKEGQEFFLANSPLLKMKPFSDAFKPWTDWGGYVTQLINLVKILLNQLELGNEILKKSGLMIELTHQQLDQLATKTKNSMAMMKELEDDTDSNIAIITHGDYHMWNIGYKGTQRMKMFDLQISRYSSPLCDIHQYLSQVTTVKETQKSLGSWLDAYLCSFNNTLEEIKCKLRPFDKESLLAEYKRTAGFGFVYGVRWNLQRFITDKAAFDKVWESVDGMSTSSSSSLSEDELVGLLAASGPEIWWILGLVADSLKEAVDQHIYG